MQREKSREMFVAQHSIMKPETDLQFKLAKTIQMSMAKPESGQAVQTLSSLKKEASLYEAAPHTLPAMLLKAS